MSGTTRTSYEGETLLDGEHGAPKRAARREVRRARARDIRESAA